MSNGNLSETTGIGHIDPGPPVTRVTLTPSVGKETSDQALWVAIRNRSKSIGFKQYSNFIKAVLCDETSPQHRGTCKGENDETKIGSPPLGERRNELANRPSLQGVDAYQLLRLATEVFLLLQAGIVKIENGKAKLLDPQLVEPTEETPRFADPATFSRIETLLASYFGGDSRLPYFSRVLEALPELDEGLPYCEVILQHRLSCPSLIELIWSYWHEEGLLVQTMNAIALRFQNRRGPGDRDPLAHLELDPLRPLNNLLWGFIQNEFNRLTVARRAYEYDHHYGLSLYGKAAPRLRSADSRSKFLEGFHNLLNLAAQFYRDDSDTTVVANGFPLLNALKEVHLSLAEGAHNQFGDLPWTARVEMLIQQWLLARPEMKEFLRGRYMVPYHEEWMGQVDAMKRLQGWSDVTITHFNELAVFGEQILLSVRYGDWSNVNIEDQAKNWARYWKPEAQSYIHSYRAATGVDLTVQPVDHAPPWVHLKRQEQETRKARR